MAETLIVTPKLVVADRRLVTPAEFSDKDRKLVGLQSTNEASTIKWTRQGRLFVPAAVD